MNSAPTTARGLFWMLIAAAASGCGAASSADPGSPADSATGGDVAFVDSGGGTSSPDVEDQERGTVPSVDSGSTGAADTKSGVPDTATPTVPCDKPAGGDACDPGKVTCGGAPCDLSSHYCCGDETTASCVASGASCGTNAVHCDEKADCSGGKICCLVAKSISSADMTCQSACTGGLFSIQVCHTNSECGAGKTCVVQTCNGAKVEACGMIPSCS